MNPSTRATRGGTTPLYRATSGVTPELMAQLGFIDEAAYEAVRSAGPARQEAVAPARPFRYEPAPSLPFPPQVHPRRAGAWQHWKMPALSLPIFSLSRVRRTLQPMQRPTALGFLLSGIWFVTTQIQPFPQMLQPLLAHPIEGPTLATPRARDLPTAAEIAASRMAREIALERVRYPVRAQARTRPSMRQPTAEPQRIQAVPRLKALRMVALAEPLAATVAEPIAEPIARPQESGNLPSIDPTSGGAITSPFGYRTDPFPEFHRGLDLAAPTGRPVLVTANGRVVFANWQGGFGNKIEVDHGNGYVTWYGHLSKIEVSVGERVTRGTIIGEVGATGEATGPHLHYQIMQNGVAINPLPYLGRG